MSSISIWLNWFIYIKTKKMIKNYIAKLLLVLFISTPLIASQVMAQEIQINVTSTPVNIQQNSINRDDVFNYYADFFRENTLESYKYITLNYSDVPFGSKLYDSLQVLVFFGLLENKSAKIYPNKDISAYEFYALSEKILGIEILQKNDYTELSKRNADINDMIYVTKKFERELETLKNISGDWELETKKLIFEDVFNTLSTQHYDKDKNSKADLLDDAIIWLTKGTDDKHTTYFPPVETQDFKENLNGEFEWIWAYVEMQEPWIFKIISPIKGSPAYKAGLKWGDRVTHVDGKEVTKNNSSNEVVSWIKWEKGSQVLLTILRDGKTFDVEVIRDQIIIKDLEYELIDSNTFYINIKNFGQKVSKEYIAALQDLKTHKNVTKVIIDVRNNWGWYLDQVAEMLSYMVPKDEPTAIIRYLNWDRILSSDWYSIVDFNDYKIVVLQNSGTASASEILAGTIKDYYPDSVSIGEQSYGKGSVQQIKEYKDGSLLKYTVARWYTGWEERWIDGIWLTPDILLELDMDQYKEFDIDNQYNKAINLR